MECWLNMQTQFITCIYAHVLSSMRRGLWNELEYLSSLINDNWFLIGDFNAYFGAHEKTGRPPIALSCQDFIYAMANCSLTCLDTRCSHYTWANNRHGIHRVDIRLD